MFTRTITFTIVLWTMSIGFGYAQQCMHGSNETTDQAVRRREALTATRTINDIQANQPGAINRLYLRHVELVGSPYAARMRESTNETIKRIVLNPDEDILPNWQLTLDVTLDGYWFMIKDRTDPCGFAYVSNEAGLIFKAEHL